MRKSRAQITDDLEMENLSEGQHQESQVNVHSSLNKTHEHEGGKDDDNSADDAEDYLDDPLNQVPPDFAKAKKHQDASKVKNIADESNKTPGVMYDEEEDFCE